MAGIFSGSVLLLHDNRGDPDTLRTGERLPAFDKASVLGGVLERIDAQELTVRTVGELVTDYPNVRCLAPLRTSRSTRPPKHRP